MNKQEATETKGEMIGDVIFGANDGIVTTFVIVAGAAGASLPTLAIIALGFANLLGDGASMGFGNYLGKRSREEYFRSLRAKEKALIKTDVPVERAEIERIFSRWGFTGPDLTRAVDIVAPNRTVALDLILREQFGIVEESRAIAMKSGMATFIAFALAGFVPLLPFLLPIFPGSAVFWSMALAALALFFVGASRSLVTAQRWLSGGFEMLLVGSASGALAYFTGKLAETIATRGL